MPPDRAIFFVNSPLPFFGLKSQRSDRTIASGTLKLAGTNSEIVQIALQTTKI